MLTDLTSLLNAAGSGIEDSPVSASALAGLIALIDKGTIGTPQGKQAIQAMFTTGKSAEAVVEELGLVQITDSGEIGAAVAQAIADNPQAVDDYMKGKESAAKFLVGQVMKVTRGKANPGVVGGLIVEQLEAMK